MKNTSITHPDWADELIETRRDKGEKKTQYVRKALYARFILEDAGEWEDLVERIDEDELEARFGHLADEAVTPA